MHTDLSFLELLFRLSIFSLLGYKLYSLIRAQLLPMLLEEIAAERKQKAELLDKEKLLVSTQHRIKNQIYGQKQMFTLIERNVQVWHKSTLDSNEAQERESQLIAEKIHYKRMCQQKNLALFNAINSSIPTAIQEAYKELTLRYQTNEGKQFLTSIIHQFPSNKH